MIVNRDTCANRSSFNGDNSSCMKNKRLHFWRISETKENVQVQLYFPNQVV